MIAWLATRWRMSAIVGSALVVALIGSLLWAFNAIEAATESTVDCSVLEEDQSADAAVKADACDAEVEVKSERTPWVTIWATAEGTHRMEASAMPVRANVAGKWTKVDSTLVVGDEQATVEVAAPVYPMQLNAGGPVGTDAPLGVIEHDEHQLDVGFPLPLPEAVVSGSRATYQLGEGIRLVVSVNRDSTGFLPVVELADPAAADRFTGMLEAARGGDESAGSGMDVGFPLTLSEGLQIVPIEGGAIEVRDPAGDVAFEVPPAIMWDSSSADVPAELAADLGVVAGPEVDRSAAPAEGDRIAGMEMTVTGTTVVVRPDAAMLADPATEWPVYLDPGFSGHQQMARIALRTGGYTGSLWGFSDLAYPNVIGQGAGRCQADPTCVVNFTQRLIWQFGNMPQISAMERADIISAGFTVNGTHSAYCSATTTELRWTDPINAGSTWGSIGWGGISGTRTDAQRDGCAAGAIGLRTYDATEAIRLFAQNNLSTITLGLKAADESSMASWKRFGIDPTLSVEYNRAPNTPTGLQMDTPLKSCATGVNRPVINVTNPVLSAIVSDPDGGAVRTQTFVHTIGSGSTKVHESWSAYFGSPSRIKTQVTSGLVDGGTYRWHVLASDGVQMSGSSVSCEFRVDTTRPVKPQVTPVHSGVGVEAVYETGLESGGIGKLGRFRLARGISTDVASIRWAWNAPTNWTTQTLLQGETRIEIDYRPDSSGPVTLYVESIDRAGNVSDRTEYSFKVAAPIEDVIYKFDENAGATAADSGPKNGGDLAVDGAAWVAGPHQSFGSRDDDWALSFDGVDDFAQSSGPILDTSESFVVSAHVRLDPTKVTQGNFTALSQDGIHQSAFELGYQAICDGGAAGCWSFGMARSDFATTSRVISTSASVTAGEWVHLVGEHNATSRTTRLWACAVGTPEQPAVGEPVPAAPAARAGTAWLSGSFVVGRGKTNGSASNWWPGQIDNVRVFTGEIIDASKLRRLCQGAEAENFGNGQAGFDAVDPTVREGAGQ